MDSPIENDLNTQQDDLQNKAERRADIRDQLVELETQIEERWRLEFENYKENVSSMGRFVQAGHSIAQSALATLHHKGIDIPSMYAVPTGEGPDPEVVEQLTTTVCEYITMGADFQKIIHAIHANEALMSEWDRFCMILRLAQED